MRYLILLLWPCLVIGQTYAGTIQTMRSPYLILTSQDVYINVDQIKVTYIYTNTANHNISETLVFVLPSKSEDSLKQFSVHVNQVPIRYQTMQRAISKRGRDISKDLKILGLPYNPIAAMHNIDASPNRTSITSKLQSLHLLDQHEDTPTWIVNTYYYWQQEFPAKSSITIEQTYKPAVTTHNVKLNSFASLLKLPLKIAKKAVYVALHWSLQDDSAIVNLQEQFEKYWPQIQDYCPTQRDYQVLLNAYKKHPNKKPQVELKEIHFAYDVDELWASPLNRFNLTIESPKNMHALLCWHDELKRFSNNSLQFSAENYIPLQNLNVLYIEK